MTSTAGNPLTEARVNVSIGSMFPPGMTETVPELGPILGYTDLWRKTALTIDQASLQIGRMPPGHRVGRVEKLAATGRAALRSVDESEAKAIDHTDQVLGRFAADLERQLARPTKNDPNHNFAMSDVRTFVRMAEDSYSAARKLLTDIESLRAVLSAPAAASGLSLDQHRALTKESEVRYMGHVVSGREIALKARDEIERSARMARKLIAESAGLELVNGRWIAPWEREE